MSQATILAKMRLVTQDFGETFTARVVGDAETQRFDLPRDGVDAATLTVYIDGDPPTVLTEGTAGSLTLNEYSLDARQGTITLWAPLSSNAVLMVEGTSYLLNMPSDLTAWVDTAFDMHIAGRLPVPTMDDLSPTEEYLVAMLAVIEMLWSMATEASGEIDIMTPEGVNIPASQRFAQIVTLLDRLDAHYRELAAALNVGPYRIMVSTLRRVSRTTNRLVPIYVAREFDDRTYPPTRVYPPIDTGLMEVGE